MKKNRFKEKAFAIAIVCILLSNIPLIIADDFDPMADTEMTMTPQNVDVGDADSFNISINIYPTEFIDAVATDLITFDPSIIECQSIDWGNFFEDDTIQLLGTIDNINGTIKWMVWGAVNETNQNGTYINMTFNALAQGTTYIIINESEAGMAYEGNVVNFNITNNVTVNVTSYVPGPPSGFTATPVNRTAIQLDWTKATKADYTWVEWNTVASWSRGAGNFISNTTGTTATDNSLDPGETRYYRAWSYNATGNNWSTTSAMDSATSQSNNPPSFANEQPVNGSTVEYDDINWSINISDDDGDTFNWTIECSDGNSSNANDEGNGTKYLNITNTAYSTSYTFWVNATDGYDWTRAWYTVTIRDQYLPDPPTDFTATKINLTAINLTWTKNISADTTYIEVNSEATWDFGNGTEIYNSTGEQATVDGLSPDHYYFQAWSYNATDNTYSTTYAEADVLTGVNDPPIQTNEVPVNESTNVDILQSSLNITLADNQSDTIIYNIESIYSSNASGSGGNNTYTAALNTPLPYNTTIYWYVNTTDGFEWTNRSYWFTTRTQYEPDPPTGIEVTTIDANQINISWILPGNADKVVVETNTTGPWTELYNDSGTGYAHTGLDGHTTYYYRISAWNTTDNTLSNYIYVSNTTENTAPEEPTAVHIKTKTGFGKNYTSVYDVRLNVTVSDNESDTLDVYFYWGNDEAMGFIGTIASGDSAEFDLATYCNDQSYWYNETEGMDNPGTWEPRNFLNHSTNYTWYVIVDDGMDTTQSPLYWFNTSARWDLVEDGDMTLDDITQRLVSEWYYKPEPFYPGGSIDTDIIEDGFIDLTDLSEFTSHWYDAPWYTE